MARRARYSGLAEALEAPLATSRGFPRVNLSFTLVARQSLPGPVRLVRLSTRPFTRSPRAPDRAIQIPRDRVSLGVRSPRPLAGRRTKRTTVLTTSRSKSPIDFIALFRLFYPNCARNEHS